MKLIRAIALVCLLAGIAHGQTYTSITGVAIQDTSGNLLTSGEICFLGTDHQNRAVNYRVGGSGGQVVRTAVCAEVTDGAIVGSLQVANVALTVPANICYRVTVTDSSTGRTVVEYPQSFQTTSKCGMQPTGASFSIDTFDPDFAPMAIVQAGPPGGAGPAGPAGGPGSTGPVGPPGAPNYLTSFTSQTSVTMTGAAIGAGAKGLSVTCYNTADPALEIEPNTVSVDPDTFDVNVTFAVAQSGYCVVNASGVSGPPGSGGGQLALVSSLPAPSTQGALSLLTTGLIAPYLDTGTQQVPLSRCTSPSYFGAVGNDTADDTDAIQAALNAAMASEGTGKVNCVMFFPGDYRQTRQLWWDGTNAHNVAFLCAGYMTTNAGGCRLRWYGPKGGTMMLAIAAYRSQFDQLMFWGNAGGDSTAASHLLRIDASNTLAATVTYTISAISRAANGIVTATLTGAHVITNDRVIWVENVTGDTTFNGKFHALYASDTTHVSWVQGGVAGSGTVSGSSTLKNLKSGISTFDRITNSSFTGWKSPQCMLTAMSGGATVTATCATTHYGHKNDQALIFNADNATYNGPYRIEDITNAFTLILTPDTVNDQTQPNGAGGSSGTLQVGSVAIGFGHSDTATAETDVPDMENLHMTGDQLGNSMTGVNWYSGGNTKVAEARGINMNGMRYGFNGFSSGYLNASKIQCSMYGSDLEDMDFHGVTFSNMAGEVNIRGAECEDYGPSRFLTSTCVGCTMKIDSLSFQSDAPTDDVVISSYGTLVLTSSKIQNNRTGATFGYLRSNLTAGASGSIVSLGNTFYRGPADFLPVKDSSNNVWMASGGTGEINHTYNITSIGDMGGASGNVPYKNYVRLSGPTRIGERVNFTGRISPSQITSDQNNYSPPGCKEASVLRLSTDASRNITGLNCGNDTSGGAFKFLMNVGTNDVVLPGESGSSSDANRFCNSVTIASKMSVPALYDSDSTCWYLQTVVASAASGGLADPGSNGIVKRTGLNATAVAVAGTDYTTPGGTETFLGKTLNCESAGNVCSAKHPIYLQAAGANAGSGFSGWDLPDANAAIPTARTGTILKKGVLAFTNGLSAQTTFRLPGDVAGNVDFNLEWTSPTSSGTGTWVLQGVCTATGAADNPAAWLAFWSPAQSTASATASGRNVTSSTAVAMPAGCAGASLMHLQLSYIAGTAASSDFIGLEITPRRTQ